jgi:hypothetical protein
LGLFFINELLEPSSGKPFVGSLEALQSRNLRTKRDLMSLGMATRLLQLIYFAKQSVGKSRYSGLALAFFRPVVDHQ